MVVRCSLRHAIITLPRLISPMMSTNRSTQYCPRDLPSFSAGITAEFYLLVGLVCIFYVHRIQSIGSIYRQLE